MFFEIYEKLCKDRDISPTRASIEIGFSKGSVSYWRKNYHEGIDAKPDLHTAQKIADYFSVTVDYLLGKEKAPGNEPNAIFLDQQNVYMIPLYETVSAGLGAYAINNAIDHVPLYITSRSEAEETICIKVTGDSMYPKIEEGDVIQVHKQDSVDSGTIAVILLDGDEGLVKRIVYGPNWIELHSINPMFPIRRFEGPAVQRIQIVGAVKKIIKNV